ncbi:DnaJ domain-containing protein [Vacuolonema iberomarrocanum]|uniref:J domain-containing protein n=1 Tax=Vacuolonema iberomarrocanum TaxID=3454632 RepID=UPI001A01AD92|nr:DnaJ domain-containing protein [filamentous cyanobacterium LEGE 07170]
MKIADCYRLLGLNDGASYDDIKVAYRRLARRYHPDVNPGSKRAEETFIQLTEAYHKLVDVVQPSVIKARRRTRSAESTQSQNGQASGKPASRSSIRKRPTVRRDPDTSQTDHQLKQQSYEQLHQLLREQRYPRAIALVEGLAQRLPQDSEIRQWQAIAYQRWGKHLIDEKQYDKARIYLQKALRTDPRNRALWLEVEHDMRRIDGVEIL